ncbi:hypothetical protein [Paracoccus sp. (in: a-proteobacteria)]|uniref:hypothetical protein n=1 Tax=Paracoccus sp. TaxID=267 RepID=UPI0026E01D4A|nr:hypothetical protein [Paracoccus sp. (in: a-proteobacteria)]MDO5646710.1 hypothetical protein [Paracoccus sp. (in: a-proteobacteria)]
MISTNIGGASPTVGWAKNTATPAASQTAEQPPAIGSDQWIRTSFDRDQYLDWLRGAKTYAAAADTTVTARTGDAASAEDGEASTAEVKTTTEAAKAEETAAKEKAANGVGSDQWVRNSWDRGSYLSWLLGSGNRATYPAPVAETPAVVDDAVVDDTPPVAVAPAPVKTDPAPVVADPKPVATEPVKTEPAPSQPEQSTPAPALKAGYYRDSKGNVFYYDPNPAPPPPPRRTGGLLGGLFGW